MARSVPTAASEPNVNNVVLRFLAFGAGGIYTNDLGDNAIDEFNLGLTAKINSITTGTNQPYAFAVEP